MSSSSPKILIVPVIVAVCVIGVIALAIYFSTGPDDEVISEETKLSYDNLLAESITESDWKRGATEPKVTIVQYSDFQCPACSFAHESIIAKIQAEYSEDVRVVYRHYPITSHKLAAKAAEAAEAAGAQGKFWEMTDMIYANQSDLTPDIFTGFAKKLDLDLEQFEADLSSGKFAQDVADDKDSGKRSGVSATPTFYINGEKYEGRIKYDDFKSEIDKRIP